MTHQTEFLLSELQAHTDMFAQLQSLFPQVKAVAERTTRHDETWR